MKLYALEIRGKRREWIFPVWVDPKYINDWREDGLKIDEIVNIIPKWYVDLGLPVKLWCIIQDFIGV